MKIVHIKRMIIILMILLLSTIVQAENVELNTFVVETSDTTYLLADMNDPTSLYHMSNELAKDKLDVGNVLTGYGRLSTNENYPPQVVYYDYNVCSDQRASEEDIHLAMENSQGLLLKEMLEDWGEVLYEYSNEITEETSNVNYIDEDELNRTIEFYKLRGDENPEELALTYVAENQALYLEAVNHGVEVTDEEVLVHLAVLKEQLENSANNQEYKIIKEQFPSDEDYWKYQFVINRKSMLVDKYLEERGRELISQNILDLHSAYFQEEWALELQKIKDNLVEKYFSGNLMDYVK